MDFFSSDINDATRLQRWRLVLGGKEADGTGMNLEGDALKMDQALEALYGQDGSNRAGGLGGSAPKVNRWLGDIRTYFPSDVVKVMQRDAYERLGLGQMLLEPELLSSLEPDVHLVSTLISLKNVIPQKTKATARAVVANVADELQKELKLPMIQAVKGALNRSVINRRPRLHEMDWHRTIRANLKHYQPDYQSIIPKQLIGYGQKGRGALKDIILCIDQSGSMAASVVYASIFGAVLATIKAVNTRMVVFDTAVADLTAHLNDPVDLLFGTQLGGGTDINKALAYCQGHIRRPKDTVLVLITDLYEGGKVQEMLKRAAAIKASGVTLVCLLALSDQGKPFYDHEIAQRFGAMTIPTFACTPKQFPSLMASAINREEIRGNFE